MFKDIDECQISKLHEIESKYGSKYWNTEMNRNTEWADPWLIALSICENAIIVTDEKKSPNHIPYIARALQRPCLSLIDFFKAIGIKY